MENWEIKKAARAKAAAVLQASIPHLVAANAKVNSLQAAAKNVRIELKRAFPGIKFSVKTDRFSGGDALRVRWTDGPVESQVGAIVDKYEAGSFDGMTDSYTYGDSVWNEAFGDAKYVSYDRDHSDQALASAIRTVKAKYAANLAERGIAEISVENFRAGRLYTVNVMDGACAMDGCLQALISREAFRRTWALNKAAVTVEDKEEVAA